MNKTYRCGFCGRARTKKPTKERKDLSGNWQPFCNYCVAVDNRQQLNNPWYGIIQVHIRDIGPTDGQATQLTELEK